MPETGSGAALKQPEGEGKDYGELIAKKRLEKEEKDPVLVKLEEWKKKSPEEQEAYRTKVKEDQKLEQEEEQAKDKEVVEGYEDSPRRAFHESGEKGSKLKTTPAEDFTLAGALEKNTESVKRPTMMKEAAAMDRGEGDAYEAKLTAKSDSEKTALKRAVKEEEIATAGEAMEGKALAREQLVNKKHELIEAFQNIGDIKVGMFRKAKARLKFTGEGVREGIFLQKADVIRLKMRGWTEKLVEKGQQTEASMIEDTMNTLDEYEDMLVKYEKDLADQGI